MMMPLLSAAFSSPLVAPAQAADACQGDTEAIEWNQTMQRMAMVPHWSRGSDSYPGYYEDDMYYEADEYYEMTQNRPSRQNSVQPTSDGS